MERPILEGLKYITILNKQNQQHASQQGTNSVSLQVTRMEFLGPAISQVLYISLFLEVWP